MLALLSVIFLVACFMLVASIFITVGNPIVGLQVAFWSFITIIVDLFLLSLF